MGGIMVGNISKTLKLLEALLNFPPGASCHWRL